MAAALVESRFPVGSSGGIRAGPLASASATARPHDRDRRAGAHLPGALAQRVDLFSGRPVLLGEAGYRDVDASVLEHPPPLALARLNGSMRRVAIDPPAETGRHTDEQQHQ